MWAYMLSGPCILGAVEHPALELEVGEAAPLLRGLGKRHDGVGGQGLLVPQPVPLDLGVRIAHVVQVGLVAISDVDR